MSNDSENDGQTDETWLQGYTSEELSKMQKEDPNIGFILEKFLQAQPKTSVGRNISFKSRHKNLMVKLG